MLLCILYYCSELMSWLSCLSMLYTTPIHCNTLQYTAIHTVLLYTLNMLDMHLIEIVTTLLLLARIVESLKWSKAHSPS